MFYDSDASWDSYAIKLSAEVSAVLRSDWAEYIENSKLWFCDMKIMSRRNGGDLVNNESAGRVVYQVTTIPEWHNFHITETQFYYSVYYIPSTDWCFNKKKTKKEKVF